MFHYFGDNYAWDLALLVAIEATGTVSEIDDGIRDLKAVSSASLPVQRAEWCKAWTALGDRLEKNARDDAKRNLNQSASRKFMRAAVYLQMAERMLSHEDPDQIPLYQRSLNVFREAIDRGDTVVEFVDVPFQGSALPSLFIPAGGEQPGPCMIHFGGFDSVKEWIYPIMAKPFRERGVSLLICDQPGVGGALRLNELKAVPETEAAASACVDYLETREEIDPKRIGLVGISLGGYYAPRAAAFEKRLQACVAWGAIWDFKPIVERRLKAGGADTSSVPDPIEFARWVFGVQSVDEYLEFVSRMTLEPIAHHLTCPILVTHGENDRQIPVEMARKTIDAAINSPRADLKIFTAQDGGVEHCQADNMRLGVDYIADWVQDVL